MVPTCLKVIWLDVPFVLTIAANKDVTVTLFTVSAYAMIALRTPAPPMMGDNVEERT